jgi:hypothetical protein
MQFLLLIYTNEKLDAALPPDEMGKVFAAYGAYTEALKAAGAYVGANPLQPTPTAKSVSGSNGAVKVADGPYAETKEQLGGYYLLDTPDIDAAVAWARRCPAASNGTVEVRPIMPMHV